MSHPSFFDLDVHALTPADDETARHVAQCQQCSAHVQAARVATPLPPALVTLDRAPAPTRRFWWVPAFAAVALVVSVVSVLRFMGPRDDVMTPKGAPAAKLWVRRDARVSEWTSGPVSPRDAVRWEIAPAGYTHLQVVDVSDGSVLLEEKVPGDAPVLTPAWSFDGKRPVERVRLYLTRDGVLPPGECRVGASSWCVEYTLALEAP